MNENYVFINDNMDGMGLHEAAHAIALPLPGLQRYSQVGIPPPGKLRYHARTVVHIGAYT